MKLEIDMRGTAEGIKRRLCDFLGCAQVQGPEALVVVISFGNPKPKEQENEDGVRTE